MSLTFTLTGNSSILGYNFNPPIYLDEDPSIEYEIGLANFDTFHMIPNIEKTNNVFVWGDENKYSVMVPVGSYELKDLIKILNEKINEQDENAVIMITANIQTAKITIQTNRKINFQNENSIGSVLGFKNKILEANKTYIGDDVVRILKINSICIDCNLAQGSYLNSKPVHLIYQFFPLVPYGYKIVESPLNIIYYPVSIRTINNITIRIIDQNGDLIDFRGEEITVRLHLRKKLS